MAWLLAVPFIGNIITILTPAFKGIMEGIVAWAKAVWHGLKTSNYGTWTLLLSVAASVYLYAKTPCNCPSIKDKPAVTKQIGKTSDSKTPSSIFHDWFGGH